MLAAPGPALFEIPANHLDFPSDFLRRRGMEKFRLQRVITKDVVADFVAGAALASDEKLGPPPKPFRARRRFRPLS